MNLIHCPRCGTENEALSNVCEVCDLDLTKITAKICPICQFENASEATECRQCGSRLVNLSEPDPSKNRGAGSHSNSKPAAGITGQGQLDDTNEAREEVGGEEKFTDWLSELTSSEEKTSEERSVQSSSPQWLQEPDALGETGAMESEELPDWLKNLRNQEVPKQKKPTAPKPRLPEWLKESGELDVSRVKAAVPEEPIQSDKLDDESEPEPTKEDRPRGDSWLLELAAMGMAPGDENEEDDTRFVWDDSALASDVGVELGDQRPEWLAELTESEGWPDRLTETVVSEWLEKQEKPIEKPQEKDIAELAEKPPEQAPEQPIEVVQDRPVEEFLDKPLEELAEKPLEELPQEPLMEQPKAHLEAAPESPVEKKGVTKPTGTRPLSSTKELSGVPEQLVSQDLPEWLDESDESADEAPVLEEDGYEGVDLDEELGKTSDLEDSEFADEPSEFDLVTDDVVEEPKRITDATLDEIFGKEEGSEDTLELVFEDLPKLLGRTEEDAEALADIDLDAGDDGELEPLESFIREEDLPTDSRFEEAEPSEQKGVEPIPQPFPDDEAVGRPPEDIEEAQEDVPGWLGMLTTKLLDTFDNEFVNEWFSREDQRAVVDDSTEDRPVDSLETEESVRTGTEIVQTEAILRSDPESELEPITKPEEIGQQGPNFGGAIAGWVPEEKQKSGSSKEDDSISPRAAAAAAAASAATMAALSSKRGGKADRESAVESGDEAEPSTSPATDAGAVPAANKESQAFDEATLVDDLDQVDTDSNEWLGMLEEAEGETDAITSLQRQLQTLAETETRETLPKEQLETEKQPQLLELDEAPESLLDDVPRGPLIPMIHPTQEVGEFSLTKEQKQQVVLLQQLIHGEAKQERTTTEQSKFGTTPNFRLAVVLILVLLISVGWLVPGVLDFIPDMPGPAISEYESGVFEELNSAAGLPVLVAFEYTPATAGEMDLVASPLLKQMANNNSSIVAVSQSAAGTAVADRLLTEAEGIDYIDLGYLPGDGVGIRKLALCINSAEYCESAFGQTLTDESASMLANIGAILVLTADRDSLVDWIEQAGAELDMGIAAGFIQPLEVVALPYLASGQLVGAVTGASSAMAYSQEYSQSAVEGFESSAYVLTQWFIIGTLIIGALYFGTSALRPKRGQGAEPK